MSVLIQPIKITELLSFAWTGIKLFTEDCYRYFYRQEVTVQIKSGQVKGYKILSSFDYQYYNFLGIPYAKAPIGELRFKDPQPFEPSNDVINRKFGRRGSMACQPDLLIQQRSIGTEDCLHLSIFTHDIQPSQLKPVMVWIHGGAFILGSNTKDLYNPEFLLRKQIVLIAINYRLGAFGFLSLKDPELGVPGNMGLKDQVMALKWVKENCMHFGGDPDNITVFGESAGAASVSMHLLSHQSKNLFHKAMVMSGSAYAPWSLSPDGGDWPQRLARELGWDGTGGEKACFRVLQKAKPYAIVKASEKLLTLQDRKQIRIIPFSPVLEPYETPQYFLRKYPAELIDSAWSKHIPIILGVCSNEGLLFYKMLKNEPELLQEFNILTAMAFPDLDLTNIQIDKHNKQLENFYSNQSTMQCGKPFPIDHFMILHDKAFAHPIHRLIMSRNKYQHAPTYLLRFDFDSTYSILKRICVGENIPGVCHGDDISYYFRTVSSGPDPPQHTHEWKTIERMCEIFSTFASVGDPNNEMIAPIEWKPITYEIATQQNASNLKCLNVSNEVSYKDWIDLERMQFWDRIYEELGYNL